MPPTSGVAGTPSVRAWLSALGPGAIVASLTIGSGELIFSSRAGALFGYRVLGVFLAVVVLKWALVMASARYWILTDRHPLQSWARLPGPNGWLPIALILLAVPSFPIWVSFHAGTLGTLLAGITGTRDALGGQAPMLWAVASLAGVLALSATGSYARQEKFQSAVVALMLLSILAAVVVLKPDWVAMIAGVFHAAPIRYPEWAAARPEFAQRPVWVEMATYAGVVGGSGYDYLAYVAWLRDKHGHGASRRTDPRMLSRLVAADATVSFLAVLVFTGAFVICGTEVLGPRHEVPSGSDLLSLQAQFVAAVGPWLKPLYFLGAFLALAGTLYGTIEVAPAVLRELLAALGNPPEGARAAKLRSWAVAWCGFGALFVLVLTLGLRWLTGTVTPVNLVALVTPANLVTGVLACGWISLLNVWTDRQHLDAPRRMSSALRWINVVGGALFVVAGVKAAWEQTGLWAPVILGTVLALALTIAAWRTRRRPATSRE